jgi:hypothetical protein
MTAEELPDHGLALDRHGRWSFVVDAERARRRFCRAGVHGETLQRVAATEEQAGGGRS